MSLSFPSKQVFTAAAITASSLAGASSFTLSFATSAPRTVWISKSNIGADKPNDAHSIDGLTVQVDRPADLPTNTIVTICILDRATNNMALKPDDGHSPILQISDKDFSFIGRVDVVVKGATAGLVGLKDLDGQTVAPVDQNGIATFYGLPPGTAHFTYTTPEGDQGSIDADLSLGRSTPEVRLTLQPGSGSQNMPILLTEGGIVAMGVIGTILYMRSRARNR